MPTVLTDNQVEELSESLKSGVADLKTAREEMDKRNTQVADLLEKQKGLARNGETHSAEAKKTTENLDKLAEEVKTLADQNTNLIHLTRAQMKKIGQATDENDAAYVVTPSGVPMREGRMERGCPGVIFKSKRQALELGMYFMATMHKTCEVRQDARDWIKEQGGAMLFLPQMPRSFIQEFGEVWNQQMSDIAKGRMATQDLAGRQTPGSVLVHPEFSDTLIRNVEEHGVFRQNALIWPMGSDTVHIPRRIGGLTVFWEGEADAGSETDPSFDLLGMTAKKMLMLHQFSSELSIDSAINLAAIMVMEFALAIATEEDRIGFNGDGQGGNSPGFAGFTGVLGAAGNATAATADANGVPIFIVGDSGDITTILIDEDELRAMTGALHTWSRAGAKWYMHRTVHSDLDGITNAAGPVVTYREGASASIMGYQIVDVEGCPVSPSSAGNEVLALGDLRKSWVLGDRRNMEIETSEHFAFNTDQLTVRAKQRVSFLMLQGNGMIVLQLAGS